jgi:hypothetical protein
MDEFERNKQLMLLLKKLHKENDLKSIELIKTFVEHDTPSIKKSFEIMTQNTPLATLLGIKTLSDIDGTIDIPG